MQKLSPMTIPAERLRNMLLEIKDKLPQTVGLPRDPRAHLFDYYKLLSCQEILQCMDTSNHFTNCVLFV